MDIIFNVQQMPSRAIKYSSDGLRHVSGGPATNAAKAVACLGGTASLLSYVGDDIGGSLILDELESLGVNSDFIRVVPGQSSSTSAIFIDGCGERLIVTHTNSELASNASSNMPLPKSDAVLSDVRWPELTRLGLQEAAKSQIPSVIDYDIPSTHVGLMDDAFILAGASHIIFSAPTLAARAKKNDPLDGLRVMAADTDAWLAVTMGVEGALWKAGSSEVHVPAFDVDAVDTLGAGDVFHGAFALELARGASEEEAISFANAVAAIKCTRSSGPLSIPTRAEVQEFLKERHK